MADLREHEMARRADVFLHPKPGTDLIWLSAITRYLLENNLADDSFLRQWVNGLAEYSKSLAPLRWSLLRRLAAFQWTCSRR